MDDLPTQMWKKCVIENVKQLKDERFTHSFFKPFMFSKAAFFGKISRIET
jgi:hypothetical protein